MATFWQPHKCYQQQRYATLYQIKYNIFLLNKKKKKHVLCENYLNKPSKWGVTQIFKTKKDCKFSMINIWTATAILKRVYFIYV